MSKVAAIIALSAIAFVVVSTMATAFIAMYDYVHGRIDVNRKIPVGSKILACLLLFAAMLLLFGCGTSPAPARQEAPPATAVAPIIVRDTVVVVDSAALTDFSRRERRLNERLNTAMELLRSYVEQESRLNARMQGLLDSMELLRRQHLQHQHTGEHHALNMATLEQALRALQDSMASITAATAATVVEVAPAADSKGAADTIALLEEKAAWLASQPRRIYTIGVEDKLGEVEVTNAYGNINYLFIALSSSMGITAARYNGLLPVVVKNGVFVYAYPPYRLTSPNVLIEVTAGGQQYAIKTTRKKILK